MGEQQILQTLGQPQFNELADSISKLDARVQKALQSQGTTNAANTEFSRLRAAMLAEGGMTAEQKVLGNTDAIYRDMPANLEDPNDHPLFDKVRDEQIREGRIAIQTSVLETLRDEPLPGKGETGFTVLTRDVAKLRAMNFASAMEGKSFGDIWMGDVDLSKVSYIEQMKLSMEARNFELMMNNIGMTPEEANKQVKAEFSGQINMIRNDQRWAEHMMLTPELDAILLNDELTVRNALMKDNARIGKWTKLEEERAWYATQFTAGLAIDVGTGFIPYVGTGTGLYMGVTGNDIFINAFTGDDYQLGAWERALVSIPVVGPLFRAVRNPLKALAKGQKVAARAGSFTSNLMKAISSASGKEAMEYVVKGGANRLKSTLRTMKELGQWGEIEKIHMDIERGVFTIADDEITLANVLRATVLEAKNPSAARAIINNIQESPVVILAKQAINNGDAGARQKITKMILDVGDDLSSARAQSVMDSLGVDQVGFDLILKDIRTVRPQEFITGAEKTILEGRKQIKVKKDRLENLKKAREASKAKAVARKETKIVDDAAAEVRAAKAPLLEEMAEGDAVVQKVKEAPVDSTVKQADGSDVRVVEQTEDTVTTIDGEGKISILAKEIEVGQRAHIIKRVTELGSVEAVEAVYTKGGKIYDFAVASAKDIFKVSEPVTSMAEQAVKVVTKSGRTSPIRVKGLRNKIGAIEDSLLVDSTNMSAFDELAKISAQLDEDIKAFPNAEGVNARLKLKQKADEIIDLVSLDDLPVQKNTLRNNASADGLGSLEENVVKKARKDAGTRLIIVDTRSGQPRLTISARPETEANRLNPFDQLLSITGGRITKMTPGSSALPLTDPKIENMWKKLAELMAKEK